MFDSRRIGRRPAPNAWPLRSPDLTPLDFFLWGTVKDIVYRSGGQITSMPQLKRRIEYAFKQTPRVSRVLPTSNTGTFLERSA